MPFNATKYRHVCMKKVFERRKIKILPVGSEEICNILLNSAMKKKKIWKVNEAMANLKSISISIAHILCDRFVRSLTLIHVFSFYDAAASLHIILPFLNFTVNFIL